MGVMLKGVVWILLMLPICMPAPLQNVPRIKGDDDTQVYKVQPNVKGELRNKRHSEEDHSGHSHVVTHILDQISKGHVTHDSMAHYYLEIQTAVKHGQLTTEEYNYLLDALAKLARGEDIPAGATCCLDNWSRDKITRHILTNQAMNLLESSHKHKRHAPDHRTDSAEADITRFLNHILDEVEKGHVTHESVSHWKAEIRKALDNGALSQEQYQQFMIDLTAAIHRMPSESASGDNYFWFGK